MKLQLLSAGDADEYEAFLDTRPEATFYHSVRYRTLLEGVLGRPAEYLALRIGGGIAGVLPAVRADGPFGTVVNSLPFFGSHGGVIAADADSAARLWRGFADLTGGRDIAAATIVENPFGAAWTFPDDVEPTFTDRRIGQVTRLRAGPGFEDELLSSAEGSARRNIRKARASGVTVEIDNGAIEFVEDCHRRNMREMSGVPKPGRFFQLLPRLFRSGTDFRIYVAQLADGRPIAALLLFYYKRFVEYFTPVTDPEYRDRQPMALILLRAMCDAAANGYEIWNWGGTWASQIGVYRFKRKWGAEDRAYAYRTYLHNSALLDSSPAALAQAYPYFYVVPFDRLTTAQTSRTA